ncbi:MAG: hypothetical protein D6689_19225 [Deltaproteobacteria bacterium]|nr:MAG: hypothetical protein D6689_19225 [Deltaproteobacteria bacterium]
MLREQPRPASPAPSGPLGPLARAPAAARSADAAIAPAAIEQHMARIVDSQRHLEAAMRRAMRGGQFSPQQLLALQFQVQKYSLEVEAVSRVVDRAVGSVKTALQTQI